MSLLDQVRATIAEHQLFERGDIVVVAVSGGADSLSLLHVLQSLREELGIALHVAHLNHQLRGEAANMDAEFVAWLAREWHLAATIEARDVAAYAREHKLSVEEAGRIVRYDFLAGVARQIGGHAIAVAHNADDQVETILMHLVRGAGLSGLRGMGYKTPIPISNLQPPTSTQSVQIVRPLLDVARAEIDRYCKSNYLAPRLDATNQDPTLFRNRLRMETLPYLETLNPKIRRILQRSAHAITEDYEYLQARAQAVFAAITREVDGAIVFDRSAWRALHPALQRGTLRLAVQRLQNLRDLNWDHIENARRIALEKDAGATATLPRGMMLTVGYGDLTITNANRKMPLPDLPLLYTERIALPAQGIVALPNSDWFAETALITKDLSEGPAERWTASFDWTKCQGAVYLRPRKRGDWFQPAGLGGHAKSLHEFMIDAKIPRAARDHVPILISHDRIAWVCGWRVDERARVTDATQEFWRVTFWEKEKP